MKLFLRHGVWYVRLFANGREYKRSTHARTEKMARRNADAIMREVALGRFAPEAERLTFQALRDRLVTDYKNNERRSLRVLEQVRLKHLRWFNDYRAHQISYELVEKYKAMRLDQDAANASINRELAALSAMFRLCGIQKPKIVMLKENNARQGFVEWADFLSIRNYLPVSLARMTTVLYVTGWRFSSVSNLLWRDITEDALRLRKEWSKNNTAVEFPMNTILKEAIYGNPGVDSLVPQHDRGHLSSIGSGAVSSLRSLSPYIFPNRTGQPYTDIRYSWKRACDKAGFRGLLIHDLKRSAVRNLLRAGVPEYLVLAMCGMKTRSIVTRYAIVSGQDRVNAANTIQGFLEGQPQESKIRKIR